MAARLRMRSRVGMCRSCSSDATCRRARAGSSSTSGRTRPSGSSTRSSATCGEETGEDLPSTDETIKIEPRKSIPFREIARVAFTKYPKRAVLCLALFIGQAFLYNAITFDLGTILSTYFGVASGRVPLFIVAFAAGNFLGPMLLGHLFDTVGRRIMVSLCYLASAAIGAILALLLLGNSLTEWTFIALVCATFFVASAGASSAYLTVSEIFPMETRALAIAFFYAVGTAIGGITGPLLFGHLIDSGHRSQLATGFFIGAAAMALGGLAEIAFGVRAEKQSLESIAEPLTAASESGGDKSGEPADAKRSPPQRPLSRRARFRPGPGSSRSYSPYMLMTPDAPSERELEREVDLIVRTLAQHGQLERASLARAVGARFWGPGRLNGALREAVNRGVVVRTSRRMFALAAGAHASRRPR